MYKVTGIPFIIMSKSVTARFTSKKLFLVLILLLTVIIMTIKTFDKSDIIPTVLYTKDWTIVDTIFF